MKHLIPSLLLLFAVAAYPQQSPAPAPASVPLAYQLGPGDAVAVTVYNMPELDRTAVLGAAGELKLSYLTLPVAAAGQTALDLAQDIADRLKTQQILLYPQVDVQVVQVHSHPITVAGEVHSPMVIQATGPLTLQDAIIQAGGPNATDGRGTVHVTRTAAGADTVLDFPLVAVMDGGDPKENPVLQAGDIVRVTAPPTENIYIAGGVQAPGAYPLPTTGTLTVVQAMALAHGWQPQAKPDQAVIVRTETGGKTQVIHLDLAKIMDRQAPDVPLEANDSLIVPTSGVRSAGIFAIKGFTGAALVAVGYLIVR